MRKTVIETSCSRCSRVETLSPAPSSPVAPDTQGSQASETPEPTFKALLVVGHTRMHVVFDDLCGPCSRAVKGLLTQVGKVIVGQSPDRAPRTIKKDAPEAKKAQAVPEKKANGQQPHAKG
jgi:hypothetical protein